ncbi:hypothetical protein TKK_0003190 [Trichogramma kaykai]
MRNEVIETHYVSPVLKKYSKSNKSQQSKGKLVDKWKNIGSFISSHTPTTSNKKKPNKGTPVDEGALGSKY